MSSVVNRSDLISGHFSLKTYDWLRDVYFSLLALARPPSAIRANRGPFCASYSVWEALVKIFCSLLTEASRKNRFFFQIFKKMTEVSQAGPCAEIQEKVNACLAENVSLTNSNFNIFFTFKILTVTKLTLRRRNTRFESEIAFSFQPNFIKTF